MSAGGQQPLPWQRAWIGLGGNVGDVAATFDAALAELAAHAALRPAGCSRRYRSPAWGPVAQADYLNAVAAFDTSMPPLALLDLLLAVEVRYGRDRQREQRWGPRRLDLDLLAIEGLCFEHPRLTLPHPRLAGRGFVLLPFAELAPALELPGLGRVGDLCAALDCSTVQAIP